MVFPHTYRNEHTETITTNYTYGSWHAEHMKSKIKVQDSLLRLMKQIDGHEHRYKHDLAKAINIQSIPSDPKYNKEIYRMKAYVERWFNKLGVKNESFDIGKVEVGNQSITLPPVILGRLISSSDKKTLCVYLYLDVLETNVEGWDTDPWTLTEKDGKYYGVGSSTSKGQLLCWMHALQAFQLENIEIPLNIKFVFESAYTMHSPELMNFLVAKKQDFFNDIDYVICNISEWLGTKYPSIVYGTVGIIYLTMTIQKTEDSTTDIEDDMKRIFSTMANEHDKILIPHFNDFVDQVTPDEERIYDAIRNFDPAEVIQSLPPHKQKWDKIRILMDFWRQPALTVHALKKCICDDSDSSIIKQDFTVKIVPKQIVEKSVGMITNHVKNTVKELGIKNKVEVIFAASIKHWIENIYSKLYQAARRATIQVYKEEPDMIREDRGRLIITILKIVFEKPVLCLPLVAANCNKFQPNEFISKKNYMEGTKLIAAFILQLGQKQK